MLVKIRIRIRLLEFLKSCFINENKMADVVLHCSYTGLVLHSTDIKRYLYKQLSKVEGLHAIVISDRDGVPVVKVANDSVDHALRPAFLGTFAPATDQSSKMGLSKNQSIVCYYTHCQVVHFNRLPLVVTFIASSSTNTGLLFTLEKELEGVVSELRSVVETSN
uniref:Late endosomal/lysosomal adaptor, MAPK and MTOR activator 3 n=1 Tax=Eptatretus burgeri TaxID=7764 RepID=A0A8C4R952_EPTBU